MELLSEVIADSKGSGGTVDFNFKNGVDRLSAFKVFLYGSANSEDSNVIFYLHAKINNISENIYKSETEFLITDPSSTNEFDKSFVFCRLRNDSSQLGYMGNFNSEIDFLFDYQNSRVMVSANSLFSTISEGANRTTTVQTGTLEIGPPKTELKQISFFFGQSDPAPSPKVQTNLVARLFRV